MAPSAKRGRPAAFDRDEVVDNLVQLFWDKGYDETSHDDMRGLTGLSGSSLYNAFGDKASIFDSVLDRYYDLTAEIIEPFNGPASGLDAVLAWVDFFGRSLVNPDKPAGCLMIASLAQPVGHNPRVKDRISRYVTRLREQLVVAFAEAAAVGDIEEDAVHAWAALIESSYIGAVIAARADESTLELEQRVDGMRHAVQALR